MRMPLAEYPYEWTLCELGMPDPLRALRAGPLTTVFGPPSSALRRAVWPGSGRGLMVVGGDACEEGGDEEGGYIEAWPESS